MLGNSVQRLANPYNAREGVQVRVHTSARDLSEWVKCVCLSGGHSADGDLCLQAPGVVTLIGSD